MSPEGRVVARRKPHEVRQREMRSDKKIGGKVRFMVLGGVELEKMLYLCSGKSKSVAECQCMRREKRLLEALQVKWQ